MGWTQPLCEACYAAFCIGSGSPPREPHRMMNSEPDPCCVCGTPTTIYVRIDPALTATLRHVQ